MKLYLDVGYLVGTCYHRKILELPRASGHLFPKVRFRAAQVSHSETVENRVVSCCHRTPPDSCSMLLGVPDNVKGRGLVGQNTELKIFCKQRNIRIYLAYIR